MGLISRMSTVVKSKISRLLDRAEDPRETLDYSYEKQLEMLRNVKRGVVEVTASRRRLEMQAARIQEQVARLDSQAQQALAAGREDLARIALQRKQTALLQIQGLDVQVAQLERQQEQLTASEMRLAAKVEAFRTQKEVIKAQYSAADASVRIGEALTGVSEEMADVGLAVQRAQDKTEHLQARAGAIGELSESGFLEDVTGGEDRVSRELAQLTAGQNVEVELAALKHQLGAGEPPKQLEEGR
ncbi:MAG: PspA/IM30 family protein [Dehalococcoidia bacterium]